MSLPDTNLVLELLVTLGSREEDIHPDPHGFRTGSHQVILPVVRLHAKGHSLGH